MRANSYFFAGAFRLFASFLCSPESREGVPGLPSAEALKNAIEYDVKIPLKLKEEIPVEKLMNLKFVEEVRKELEGKKKPLIIIFLHR